MQPHYVTAQDVGARLRAAGESVACVIGFGGVRPQGLAAECPFAHVDMPLLEGGAVYEVWTSHEPIAWRGAPGLRFGATRDMLFGVVESDPAHHGDIEAMARHAYDRLFALADKTGFPHVLRVYNYLPRITAPERGVERYRLFNTGRHDAFTAHRRATEASPAACALGTADGPPVIYFLAGREAGRAIENPRQVSAYHYPDRYGPRSPSFSRAMLVDTRLFISGTASIVGHESVHLGDPSAQAGEVLKNFSAMLATCGGASLESVAFSLRLKVYVRRREDFAAIKAGLAVLPAVDSIVYLQADICRPELLVEIEACCDIG